METDPKRIALRFLAFAWFYVLLLATIARDVNAGGLVVYLGPPLVLSLLRVNLRYGTAISLVAMALAQQALGQALAGWSPGETRTSRAVRARRDVCRLSRSIGGAVWPVPGSAADMRSASSARQRRRDRAFPPPLADAVVRGFGAASLADLQQSKSSTY